MLKTGQTQPLDTLPGVALEEYNVRVTETVSRTYTIRAASPEAARDRAMSGTEVPTDLETLSSAVTVVSADMERVLLDERTGDTPDDRYEYDPHIPDLPSDGRDDFQDEYDEIPF